MMGRAEMNRIESGERCTHLQHSTAMSAAASVRCTEDSSTSGTRRARMSDATSRHVNVSALTRAKGRRAVTPGSSAAH